MPPPIVIISALTLPYSEHLGPTYGARALSCRLAILHSYTSSILHFPFSTAFYAVGLHVSTSFLLLYLRLNHLPAQVNSHANPIQR